jgi:hypothetical protein
MFRATATTLAGVSTSKTVEATPGGDIDTAAPLTGDVNLVNSNGAGGAVKLPPAIGGVGVMVASRDAGVQVFPDLAADTIGAGSAGAAYGLSAGATMFFCVTDGVWTYFEGGAQLAALAADAAQAPAKAA